MANYDVNKLTKLAALKTLAENFKGKLDDLDTRVDSLEETVEGLTTTGGEKNVITSVKVNGAAQTVAEDRSVDISVPAKVGDLENDAGYRNEAEVKSAVDAALNKFATDVSDDGVVNTYKELVDYAAEHKGEAASMAGDIAKNKSDIEALQSKVGDADVSEQIEGALEGYAKLTDIPEEYEHPASAAGAKTVGLYKVSTDANGHVTEATPVVKKDVTDLGIPESDTTYENATPSASGLMSAEDKTKLDGIEIAADEEVAAMLDEVFAEN